MKKRLYLMCLIHSIVLFCTGQSVPSLFNYQIAVRNAEGLPISNRLMSFQVSIADNPNGSNSIFKETYNQKTNGNGIASFQIGSGTRVGSSVSLSKVPFLQNEYFVNIEVDTNNGNNFKTISTTQLISVPYAMTSDSANFAFNARQLDRNGANLDQVLKWDGQKWAPKNDSLGTGSNTYISGTGIEIKSGVISNSGDTDANNDITNVTAAGGDLSGTFPNLKVTGIQNNPISTNTPSLGQVLKWDGSNWRPSNDSLGSGSVALIAGNGISIANGRISNIGDIDSLNDITTTTKAGGDLKGNFPNLSVNKIQGDSVSITQPLNNQILQWDSLSKAWIPRSIQGSNSGWSLTGNSSIDTSINFIGTKDDKDLIFKRNNVKAGILGKENTAFGEGALTLVNIGMYNTAIGIKSLAKNNFGYLNTAIGYLALLQNLTGSGNTAIGYETLRENRNSDGNIAIGGGALATHRVGNLNIAIGEESLTVDTSGYNNIAVGGYSLKNNRKGNSNTVIGYKAMFNNSSGSNNEAFGCNALESNTEGTNNTAIGSGSLCKNKTGYENVAIGYNAIAENTGDGNTALGSQSLLYMKDGNFNTALGYGTITSSMNFDSSTAIGSKAIVTASNRVVIGHNSPNIIIGGYKTWSNLSDGRFKENIKEDVPGMKFINLLNPKTYNIDIERLQNHITSQMPDSIAQRYYPSKEQIQLAKNTIQSGFIAQEVLHAANQIGYVFDGVTMPQNSTDTYSIGYGQFVPSIVKAIQEQQSIIESQNRTIEELNVKIADLDQLKVKLFIMESELTKIKEILLKNEK